MRAAGIVTVLAAGLLSSDLAAACPNETDVTLRLNGAISVNGMAVNEAGLRDALQKASKKSRCAFLYAESGMHSEEWRDLFDRVEASFVQANLYYRYSPSEKFDSIMDPHGGIHPRAANCSDCA